MRAFLSPLEQAETFLRELTRELPTDCALALWRRRTRRSIYSGSVERALLEAERDPADLYVGVGFVRRETAETIGVRRRPRATQIAGLLGFWLDLDLKPGGAGSIEDALRVAAGVATPTVIVESGHGLHVWHLFDSAWIVRDDEERSEAEAAVLGWHVAHRQLARFRIDSTHDLARLMRVPGTINAKNELRQLPVVLRSYDGPRYDRGRLLLELPKHVPVAAARTGGLEHGSEPLPIGRLRQIVESLCETERGFVEVWDRRPERFDGDDSRYDWAIGRIVLDRGFSTEEAIGLMKLHRSTHNPGDQKVADERYYVRTVRNLLRDRPGGPRRSGPDKPTIRADDGDLAHLGDAAWAALVQTNETSPEIFTFGDVLCRVEDDGESAGLVRPISRPAMRYSLARAARWVRAPKQDGAEAPARVPMDAVDDVLAKPNPPVPRLDRVVSFPVITRAGTVSTARGYADGLFLTSDFEIQLSDNPTPADARREAQFVLQELLADFPFVGESDRAHALALLLLPFVRELISGPTPVHLIEKPTPGTGATLLVEVLLGPSLGGALATMTASGDNEEMRKRITAKLMTSPSYILFDNLGEALQGEAIAAAVTATVWEDRILGFSRTARVPVRCAWVATGNNPTVSAEVARRTVRCRLDAKMPDPWARAEFRHPNLRAWARGNRSSLVRAALTIGLAWLAAGRPYRGRRLGMFESYCEVIGGALEVARPARIPRER